jgi:hypothetical protein
LLFIWGISGQAVYIFSILMIKKTVIGLLIVLVWFALAIGASKPLYYTLLRENLLNENERYGDMYRFSNLPQFKQLQTGCKRPYEGVDSSKKQNVALYSIGDSFLEEWRINGSDFPYKFYKNIHWHDENIQTILDSTKTNILLLQCAERHARERFGKVPLNYKIVKAYESEPWVPRSRLQRLSDIITGSWNSLKKIFSLPKLRTIWSMSFSRLTGFCL